MAKKTNSTIDTIITEYIDEVKKNIHVDNVFLFGSAAKKQMKKDSDIDLIIISKDFSAIPYMERLQLLSRANLRISQKAAIDSFGYTPEEFAEMDKVDSLMLKQIKLDGYFITH